MAAAKRISKRQLKDDKFVDAVVDYWNKIRENQNFVLLGLLLIIALIFLGTWGVRYRQAAALEVNQEFSAALGVLGEAMENDSEEGFFAAERAFQDILDNHAGKDVGKWSRYFIGYCAERQAEYPRAKEEYEQYLKVDPKGDFSIQARSGLAVCEGSIGRMKVQADMMLELANSGDVPKAQADAWRYQAGKIYMDNGYFDLAEEIFKEMENSDSSDKVRYMLDHHLKALTAIKSS